jgi:RNA polymerase sigma factor for flagellar operon FliA
VSREQTADPAELAIANLMRERLEVAIENLPARERDLILSSYYDDLSLHEIARRVGVSAQRMSQLHLRALRHLKAAVA